MEQIVQRINRAPEPIAFDAEPQASDAEIKQIAQMLLSAKRPVLYVGSGIRISKSLSDFLAFLEEWPLATVTGWNSHDLSWDEHPCYCGRPGTLGNRAGNFAVQFADCVVTIGCRLNIRQISYNWQSFAKDAWRCHVDIDRAELDKPTLCTDLKVHATIRGLFPRLSQAMNDLVLAKNESADEDLGKAQQRWKRWINWIQDNLRSYPVLEQSKPLNASKVNPYRFISELFLLLEPGDHCVCADGTACVVGFQAAIIKPGQRLFHNSGCASMGYDLPAAIGAFLAIKKRVICIAGDGSIMMNLQELSIISALCLPIKIFLLNNGGYRSIGQTQNNFFPNNIVGCDAGSGLPFPDFAQIAQGFGLSYRRTENESMLKVEIKRTLSESMPIIHEIILDPDQEFEPKLASIKLADGQLVTSELEDMSPSLGADLIEQLRCEALNL
jgi:acetolactate synthase-1/2/3 large subunit